MTQQIVDESPVGDEHKRALEIANSTRAEIEKQRDELKQANRRHFWRRNKILIVGLVSALLASVAMPLVQLHTAVSTAARDVAIQSGPTKALAIIAALGWLLVVAQGVVYVAHRLLTLPARIHTEMRRDFEDVDSPGLQPEDRDKLRRAIAKHQRQQYHEGRRALLRNAGILFVSTVFLFAFWYWMLGVRDTSGTCDLLGYPSLTGSGSCDGHFWWSSLYLSVSTITTLGYGDVQPLGVSRILAGVEALTGLLYTGVFIAGLTRVLENTDFEE